MTDVTVDISAGGGLHQAPSETDRHSGGAGRSIALIAIHYTVVGVLPRCWGLETFHKLVGYFLVIAIWELPRPWDWVLR